MLVLVPAVVPVKVPAAAAAAVAAAVVVDVDVDVGMLVSTAVASQAAMSPHPATTGQRLVRPKSRLGCWAWGVRGVQWCGAGGWQGGRAEHSTQGEPRKQSGSAATHRMYTAWCSVADEPANESTTPSICFGFMPCPRHVSPMRAAHTAAGRGATAVMLCRKHT